MQPHPSSLAALVCACTLVGCIAPKATVVRDAGAITPAADSAAPTPTPPPDDGFRTGELLVLPKDTEYRPTRSTPLQPDSNSGTVIVNPPTSPPPGKKNE